MHDSNRPLANDVAHGATESCGHHPEQKASCYRRSPAKAVVGSDDCKGPHSDGIPPLHHMFAAPLQAEIVLGPPGKQPRSKISGDGNKLTFLQDAVVPIDEKFLREQGISSDT